GIQVDLIGAVHIGDKAYFSALNERFRDYDVLLFELVTASPALAESQEPRSGGLLTSLQVGLKNALGLSFQLEEIDYAAPNFVHADLSPEQLLASMKDRGESPYVYFWRLFYFAIDEYARDPLGLNDWQIASQLMANPEDDALKITLALEMVRATKRGDFLGNEQGSALIEARNARAITVLREQLDQGAERVGIFYGAAHMVDFDKRLIEELGMQRAGVEWEDAWLFQYGGATSE
ncbi:MAG: hypothetical protein HKP32_05705, partial [Woeseia sp.]|nr:hypothetical protein [Woeseia sp.]